MSHPRLPLVACWDSERPAVRVWDCGGGQLRELGVVGAEEEEYGDVFGWDRMQLTPAAAWHPQRPLLVVATAEGLRQWTPDGVSAADGGSSYRSLAFSPDGRALWASPSADEEGEDWESSDVIDLGSGVVGAGPGWDTGVATHPGGGLVATLVSDQGATHCLFARAEARAEGRAQADEGAAPAAMRPLRQALILDCDGYEAPVFSADGRHFAIRGNAYGNYVEVFEFPSLRRVLFTPLGDQSQMESWSRQNLAFAARPGVLWIATPDGSLLAVDVETRETTEHNVPVDSRLTALAVTATGELLTATDGGLLFLLSVLDDPAPTTADTPDSRELAEAAVGAFLAGTSELPADADLDSDLVLTDGIRTWIADDLSTVTEADATDPTWLQLRAAVNKLFAEGA
ncbi:hypothetical protein [Streptacidiphilus jiangxiensis]|uniref:WD40 repeat n=1 Tax=Streptacidiphilus jiangxiensis TaxID=235985 RepID=A0A1H7T3C1_STRJI|nr:hypothetical protein [Streptacidiphilus jiangxiensis]SEL78754.1 hypothetical protein SAMN05414137_11327 [Streptacidiphilus jiangxiensis]